MEKRAVEKRGFTLVELALVLALIGILIAVTVPTYDGLIQRARALEARTTLETIVHAEHAHRRDHGRYVGCEGSPISVPGVEPQPFDATRAGWKELGVRIDAPVFYRYEVVLKDTTFVAVARGDLDGDGVEAIFRMRGDTFELEIENETE